MKCLIPFCKNYANNHPEGIRFYRITEDRYPIWMAAIRRTPEPSPVFSRRICSEHFTPDSFMQIGQKIVIKNTAVPTLKLRPVPYNKMVLTKKPSAIGRKCSLKNCKNYYHELSTFTFHELPFNEHDKKRWLDAIPNDLLEDVRNIIICSAHFSLDNYQLPTVGLTKRMLKKTATPNLFDCHETVDDSEKENNKQLTSTVMQTAPFLLESRTTPPLKQDVDTTSCSSNWVEMRKATIHAEVQTSCQIKEEFRYCEREKKLLKRICSLQRCLDRRDAKIKLMKSRVEHLITHGFYNEGNIEEDVQDKPIPGGPERSDEDNEDPSLANNITSQCEMVWVKCRTCLKKSNPTSSSSIAEEFILDKSFKEVILLLVPQMVIGVGDVICFECSEILKSFAKFIKRCIEVEEVLKGANEQKKKILRRNEEVTNMTNNSLTKSKSSEVNSEYLPPPPSNENKDKVMLQVRQDLQMPRKPNFKSGKPISTCSDTHKNDSQPATEEEVVEFCDTEEPELILKSATSSRNNSTMESFCGPFNLHHKQEIGIEPIQIIKLRETTQCKESLLTKEDETVPCTIDIFDNTSSDNGDINSLEISEEVQVITEYEEYDNDTTNQTVTLENSERFEIIEEGFLHLHPIKNHDRVISVTGTNEILAGAKKSNIDIYQYGSPKGELANKRILFFGSVIVQCPKCKIMLQQGQNLENHIKSIHCDMELPKGENNKPCNYTRTKTKKEKSSTILSCPVCKINVYTTTLLAKHLRRFHENYKPYKCEKCGRSFKAKHSQVKHVKKYEEFGSCDVRKCHFCSIMVSRKNYLSHSKTHTKSFLCNECGEAFITAHHLEYHSAKHRIKKENLQLCPICGKMKKNLIGHLKTHETGPKKYMCHECPKFFMTQTQLNRHITRVHLGIRTFQCTECKMKFSTGIYLKEHYKLKHSNTFPHTCNVCGKGFSRLAYLRKHVNIHILNGRRKRQRKYCFPSDKPSGLVKCKYCSKEYKTLHRLRIHLLEHVKRLRYKCKFCTLTFSSRSNKYRHEKIHKRPDFKLSCEVCFKQMETKEELDQHMLKHEGAKKYKCQYCGILCARQYLLNHHISESHTTRDDLEKEKQTMLADALEEFLL